MRVHTNSNPQLTRQSPQPPHPPKQPQPDEPKGGVIDHIGAVQLGGLISDIGMGAAYTFGGPNAAISGLGFGIGAVHLARGGAFAMSALTSEGMKLQHRIGVATAETMLAGGHILGALGAGGWSVPLLTAGAVLNAVADYRYRTHYGVENPPTGSVAPGQVANVGMNGALALGYASGVAGPGVGIAAGVGHAVATAGYYGGSVFKPEMKHHWHSKGFGHALQTAGHFATSAGAGVWGLIPVAGGTLITTLQDYRQK